LFDKEDVMIIQNAVQAQQKDTFVRVRQTAKEDIVVSFYLNAEERAKWADALAKAPVGQLVEGSINITQLIKGKDGAPKQYASRSGNAYNGAWLRFRVMPAMAA
jgi:hypothetical protein